MSSYNLFAQSGVTHTAHSYTQFGSNPSLSSATAISTNQLRFENPAVYRVRRIGRRVEGRLDVELFAQNLTNVIQSTWTSTAQFSLQQAITRPRVVGVQAGVQVLSVVCRTAGLRTRARGST